MDRLAIVLMSTLCVIVMPFFSTAEAGTKKIQPPPTFTGTNIAFAPLTEMFFPDGTAKAESQWSPTDTTIVHESGTWKWIGDNAYCITWQHWPYECRHLK